MLESFHFKRFWGVLDSNFINLAEKAENVLFVSVGKVTPPYLRFVIVPQNDAHDLKSLVAVRYDIINIFIDKKIYASLIDGGLIAVPNPNFRSIKLNLAKYRFIFTASVLTGLFCLIS